ncbi:MAG: glycosyltransferase family 9 protein [Thermoplasmata archaeon]|nr:glycosyltransferase family 9 protein [Thermoplasmata archaeon]
MIKTALKIIERLFANALIFRYKFTPKRDYSNKMLILADFGIGDLIMFLPVIAAIYKSNKYSIYFKTERASVIEILKGMFPNSYFISPYKGKNGNAKFIGYAKSILQYKFGISLLNLHQLYKSNIKLLVKLNIPTIIGHTRTGNKYNRLWTHPVEYGSGSEVDENIKLLKPLGLTGNPKLFFKVEPVVLPFRDYDYALIQVSSYTDSRKDCWDVITFVQKITENIIFIGSVEEKETAEKIIMEFPKKKIVNMCGKLNIFQTAYTIQKAKEFHCNEGGLAHIASALNVYASVHVNPKIKTENIFHKNLNYIYEKG